MAVGEGFEPSTRAINPSASLAGRCIQPALPPSHGGQSRIRTYGPLRVIDVQDQRTKPNYAICPKMWLYTCIYSCLKPRRILLATSSCAPWPLCLIASRTNVPFYTFNSGICWFKIQLGASVLVMFLRSCTNLRHHSSYPRWLMGFEPTWGGSTIRCIAISATVTIHETGFEPVRSLDQRILSPLRLPIPPLVPIFQDRLLGFEPSKIIFCRNNLLTKYNCCICL